MPEPAHSLLGRGALITGVSRREGIGFAIAHRFASLGAHIVVQGFPQHDADYLGTASSGVVDSVMDELRAVDPGAVFIEADFAEAAAAAQVVEKAIAERGPLDILVANHARSSSNSLDDVTARELDLSFAVNTRGSLLLAQAFAGHHDGSSGGRIVLMTSGQGGSAMPGEVAYAVSKGAIAQITRTLAAHLMPRGITVNTVNPGPTDTGWADAATRAEVERLMPTGRWGSPSNAGRLIALLCSDEAAWVTGQIIDADGGFSL
ncbi:MAG TPA: SDR family oxidoreductase [Gaiellales bacterium]|nr:SDR family oxidoreductase [Gaiellales bacterium]